jgi:hypothetical protein
MPCASSLRIGLTKACAKISVAATLAAMVGFHPAQAQGQAVAQTESPISSVDGIFAGNPTARRAAQTEFLKYFSTDTGAITQLVEKAQGNLGNAEGVYDALSVLDRLPKSFAPDADLRQRIVNLANSASNVTPNTPRLAADLRRKYATSQATAPASTLPALTPRYTVKLGQMEIFNGVAQGPFATDDDTGTLAVVDGLGHPHGPVSWGRFSFRKGDKRVLGTTITDIPVPNDEHATITISWNAINNGHGSVADIIGQLGDKALDAAKTNKNPWVVVGSIVGGGVWKFAFADCDMELFSQGLVIDGALLHDLA